ncbi:DUF421 domain-containing protein [Lentilactobacillus parabuchneri]
MKTNLQFFADPNPEPKPNDSNPNPDGKNPKPAGKTYTQDDIGKMMASKKLSNIYDFLHRSISKTIDLGQLLRTAGVYDIKDVKRAILEQNGQLTVLNRGEGSIRYPVIVDGQIDPDVLDVMGKDQEWLDAELSKQGVDNIRDVYWATYRENVLQVEPFPEK